MSDRMQRPEGFHLPLNITLAEACVQHGVSGKVMRRWAGEVGHTFLTNSRRISYRDMVADMKPLDAVEYLLEILAQIDPDDSSREMAALRAHGFTPREAVFVLMLQKPFVPKAALRGRLSAGREFDVTDRAISDIVTGVRRKLQDWPIAIVTQPDVGWHIRREGDLLLPWET